MWIPVKYPKMEDVALKFGEAYEEWKCCLCCHVRTATIFLGLWHLTLHMLTLSMLAFVIRHPELAPEPTVPALPTPLSSDMENLTHYSHEYGKYLARNTLEYQHMNVSVVILFAIFAITLLMIYGAIKGKPSFLMPFFCLQLFDFCIASLTALTYICYLPDMHRLVAESPRIPFQTRLLLLTPKALTSVVVFTFITAMLIKAYFISIVWRCYRYLSLRIVSTQRTLQLIEPESAQDLLPDYETAVNKFPTPPPSYNQAISHPTV